MLNAVAVVVSIAIALAVALFGQERRVKPWFVTMCLACACLCAGVWVEYHFAEWARLAARVNMTAALVLAGAAVIATRTMAVLPVSRPVVALLAAASLVNVATVWATDLYFTPTLVHYPWGVYVGANPRFVANPLLVTVLAGYAVVLVARQYRAAHPLERNRTKYLLASFSMLALSVLDYLPHFGVAPFGAPVGAVFTTLFLFLFGYACLRYRLVVFRELVGRAVGWVLAFGAMALAYALALEAARRGGAAVVAAGPLAGTLAAAAVYALLGRAVPAWTQRLLGVREPDYPHAIRDYSDTITSMLDEAAIRAATSAACASVFDARGVALLEGPALEAHPVFAHFARSTAAYLEVEVLRRRHAIADAGPYELFLPVSRHGELVGVLAVERRSDGRMYSPRALDSMRTLANVLGMAIASARAAQELAERLVLLEAKNREVGVLNDELRRQVTDRSQKLAEALQRVGALPARRGGTVAVGQSIDGRYQVVRELGAGGMGVVYEVTRASDGRRFALKILTAATSGASLARLAREAEVAGRIAHPNLVAIADVDVSSAGELYVVMELVEGRSLAEAEARYGDVPWALGVLAQVASGLAALHADGVVHRDLKPGNVLLAGDERAPIAKIADFGIARVADGKATPAADRPAAEAAAESGADPLGATASFDSQRTPTLGGDAHDERGLTRTGIVMGTPRYMAPEQLVHGVKDAPPSADVWSFGVLAVEVLCGARIADPPLPAMPEARARAVGALRGLRGLPGAAAEVLARTLSVKPAERPTASELAEALAAAARGGA